MGTSKYAGGNPAMDKHPIQGGRSNPPSRFLLRKPELSALHIGHMGLYKDFPFFFFRNPFFFRNHGFQLFDLVTQRILSPCCVTRPNIDCEGDNASL